MILGPRGNLWIGTLHGLNKFNGTSVTTYRTSKEGKNSISDNFIQSLSFTSDGKLWVGTISGGLNLYDPKQDSFLVYRYDNAQKNSLPSDNITCLFTDSQNRLWVGTSQGLSLYVDEKNLFNNEPFDTGKAYYKDRIRAIYEDHLSRIWVATERGVLVVQRENRKFEILNHENSDLPNLPVTSIYEDEGHNVWLGTLGGGLFRRSPDGKLEAFTLENDRLRHNTVLAVTGDRQGKVFVGTEGGGLHTFSVNSGHQITNHQNGSLAAGSIHSLHYDAHTRILWVGSYHLGVFYFSQWQKDFLHLQKPDLSNNHVLSFSEDNQGNVYVGTDGGGINLLQPTGQIKFINTVNSNLPSNVILSSMIEKNGNQWFGTFQGGLAYRKDDGDAFQIMDESSGLSHLDISAIHRDQKGNLWIGTMQGGLNLYDEAKKEITVFKSSASNPSSISGNFIAQIEDFNSEFLVVVSAIDVDLYEYKTGKFHSLSDRFGKQLTSPVTYLKDSRGNIWIGCRDELVCFLTDGSTRSYNTNHGLPTNYITSIEEDEEGNLWIGTQRGLVKAIGAADHPEKPDFHVFTEEDGLQGLDFRVRSSFKTSQGRMYFGGNNGLNAFYPDEIWLNPVKPEVTFTDFKLFNESLHFRSSPNLSQPIEWTDEIELSHQENMFSIEFSSSNYLIPEKNQFAYLLEGFDKNWNYVGNNNSANYTNVPPGNYLFKVKSANNDGIWNDDPAKMAILIVPPWWHSPWFIIVAVMSILASIMFIFKMRGAQYKRRQKQLQAKIAEATAELTRVNQLLEHNNEDLTSKNLLLEEQNHALEAQAEKINELIEEIQASNEAKLKFFTNISHELRTPLTLIISPLKELLQKQQQDNRDTYQLMYENANRLLKTVNQLLDFRKLETGNTRLSVSKNELVEFTRAIFNSFVFLASKRAVQYKYTADSERCIGWIDHEKVEKILLNLLSNAFKFTSEGDTILMQVRLSDPSKLEVEISDTGQGIAQEEVDRIFDIYYQGSQISHVSGSGIGLALIKQFTELHHGQIDLRSEVGKGTIFTLNLPILEDAYTDQEKLDQQMQVDEKVHQGPKSAIEQTSSRSKTIIDDSIFKLLIVEDNDSIRAYLKNALEKHFQIMECNNGQTGLEIINKELPDFVISDVMMPLMTGTEMCRKIKANPATAHIPVTLLTAYAGEENTRDGFSSGADDYMVKPFDIDLLTRKMLNKANTRSQFQKRFVSHTSLDISDLTDVTGEEDFMKKAIQVVHHNLSNNQFGVDDFSSALDLNRRTLLRKIKSHTGLSVNEFIRNVRLKKSTELLINSDMNISEVAYASGFTDPKYFSRCFRQDFGMSPKEYIEKHSVKS